MARKIHSPQGQIEPLAACPGGISFPIRELHVNLFPTGNYLLFGLYMCLIWVGGWKGS